MSALGAPAVPEAVAIGSPIIGFHSEASWGSGGIPSLGLSLDSYETGRPGFDWWAALAVGILCICGYATGLAMRATCTHQDYFAYFDSDSSAAGVAEWKLADVTLAGGTLAGQSGVVEWVVWLGLIVMFVPFAVWGIGQHRAYQRGLALHRWTQRYWIPTAIGLFFTFLWPWTNACAPSALYFFIIFFTGLLFLWGKLCLCIMLSIKVRAIGHDQVAQFLGLCIFFHFLACFIFLASIFWHPFLAFPKVLYGIVWVVFYATAAFIVFSSGLLIASAVRASGSASAAVRRSAGWAALSGVAAVISLTTWIVRAILLEEYDTFSLPSFVSIVCDIFFDNVCVIAFSGLVGPLEMRRASHNAFTYINRYTEVQLQEFYEIFLDYVQEAEIKWVRVRFLRQLASEGRTMPRCQEVPASESVIGSEGFPPTRAETEMGGKHRWAVSHPWLSKGHPDPEGKKLGLLVDQLDALGARDNDGMFIDFMSIPQHDSQDEELRRMSEEDKWPKPGRHPSVRTTVEEECFKKALKSMETIFSVANIPVIVLPMENEVDSGRDYISRGWCFLEFCLALSFGTIVNARICPEVQRLQETVEAMGGNTIEGFRKGFRKTHFTRFGDEELVLRLFEQTLSMAK